ncbi:exo-alpha-sialidase, partial [bacterium]|nr:exo-alpha-sialidase [bacterium]
MQPIAVQIRRDTEANWNGTGTILRPGEQSYSTDTNVIKVGDGLSTWTALPPIGGGGGSSTSPLMTDNFMLAGGSSTAPQTALAYSYDGLTWVSSPTNIFDSGRCNQVAWNGSIWVAVGKNATNGVIASSPDGIRWTVDISGTGTPFLFRVETVTWNGSLWVAGGGGSSGGPIATSTDGKTWTERTSPFNPKCSTVASNGNMFVAGSYTDLYNKIAYSYDGITWVNAPIGNIFGRGVASDKGVYSIAWNGRLWVAGGDDEFDNIAIATSPDGINWTKRTTPGSLTIATVYSIAWNGSLWMAVGANGLTGEGFVSTSPNGTTWTDITANIGATNPFVNIQTVSWNGARWFLGGNSPSPTGVLLTSADTITWTSKATGIDTNIYATASRRVLPYICLLYTSPS